jgi:hypothetical protein
MTFRAATVTGARANRQPGGVLAYPEFLCAAQRNARNKNTVRDGFSHKTA